MHMQGSRGLLEPAHTALEALQSSADLRPMTGMTRAMTTGLDRAEFHHAEVRGRATLGSPPPTNGKGPLPNAHSRLRQRAFPS